jgi:crotonobetainyl-CoA:carnitine CoA-transferase CaiB-like acyl-CoA transferase
MPAEALPAEGLPAASLPWEALPAEGAAAEPGPPPGGPAGQREPAGPLAGLRVIDLTRALAGPFCTLVLAGLGADVIKVEDPEGGDISRGNAPYLGADGLSLARTDPGAMSLAVLNRCRGKRSITLDLKRPGAVQVFLDLVRQADIVVENFSSGTADRLGVGYAAARAANPAVIYCSISGFGANASNGLRAMDTIIQALSGTMLTSGAPGEPPVRVGVPMADVLTPVWAVVGILAALHRRTAGGAGEYVDVSMLGTLTSLVATEDWSAMEQLGQVLRTGPTLPRLAPFGIYRCADGWAAIVAPQDKLVADLFTVMERQDLLTDPRFTGRDARVQNEGELTRQIELWTSERPTAEVVARLSAAGVPAAPVRSPQDAVADERVTAREETLPVEHPTLGQFAGLRTSGIPFRLADARVGFDRPAPRLGEHTEQVLTEVAGYTAGQLAALRQAGILGQEVPLEP